MKMDDLKGNVQLFDDGDMFANLDASSSIAVIGHLADHLLSTGHVFATYKNAVVQRESIMPTGLPLEGDFAVAVPHTDPEHVARSRIAVATLTKPVKFYSMDDPDTELSVSIVFLLALKSKEEQLETLVAISQMLQDANALNSLQFAKTKQELHTSLRASLN